MRIEDGGDCFDACIDDFRQGSAVEDITDEVEDAGGGAIETAEAVDYFRVIDYCGVGGGGQEGTTSIEISFITKKGDMLLTRPPPPSTSSSTPATPNPISPPHSDAAS